jgi:hypothetical protein
MLLGQLRSLGANASGLRYEAELHRGLPELLTEGLAAGQYGSSFRARAVKSSVDPRPPASAFNPDRLPQVVRTELQLLDVGPNSLPAYSSTSARLRSTAARAAEAGDRPGREAEALLVPRRPQRRARARLAASTKGTPWPCLRKEVASLSASFTIEDDAQVVALDSFRPAMSAEIERGRFYKLSDPAVRTWPEMFALVIRVDRILDEIIDR